MARCGACGTADELLYRCGNCTEPFCERHVDPATHNCAEGRSAAAATADGRRDFGRRRRRVRGATAPAPADRPGYGAGDRPGGSEGGRPRTLGEWFRRQTYLSLSLKTAGLATLASTTVWSTLAMIQFGLLPVAP